MVSAYRLATGARLLPDIKVQEPTVPQRQTSPKPSCRHQISGGTTTHVPWTRGRRLDHVTQTRWRHYESRAPMARPAPRLIQNFAAYQQLASLFHSLQATHPHRTIFDSLDFSTTALTFDALLTSISTRRA